MKKQLHEFLKLNAGRLFLLSMLLFIGQGVVFSQADIIVSTDADGGAGSLRKAIIDAVDGDVIGFNGAITTITLESTLNLGDKTITIDGGGKLVLERNEAALGSFRIVTIYGDPGKVVTLKNLTIQNGIAKGQDGGGLLAIHNNIGHTVLEGITFQNNTTDGKGGGAYLEGFVLDTLGANNIVKNCTFNNNEAIEIGDGGGAYAFYTEFHNCSFTKNNAGDDGGAAYLSDGSIIENSTFTGNTAGDSGGAMRVQDRTVDIIGCTFDSNSSVNGGGAIILARGEVFNSVFINNITDGDGGAIYANQNECTIDNCTFSGNEALIRGGAVWIDDGGIMSNCIVNSNSAYFGGGVYARGLKSPATLVNTVIANNKADSVGGGLFVLNANAINCTFTKNSAGINGGAFIGMGNWFIANSIFFDNDATGADKDIQVASYTVVPNATNCALSVEPASWNATNITVLNATPFVGGSEADSLMLPSGSALIDAGDTTGLIKLIPDTDLNGVKRVINGAIDLGAYEKYVSLVVTNADDSGAGSLRQTIADAVDGDNVITFADDITTIKVDQPLELGDKTVIIDGGGDVVLDGAFNADPTLDIYRVITVTGDSAMTVTIKNLTVQNGFAQGADGGGLSADHSAKGKTILENIIFKDNTAVNGGGVYIFGYNADTACLVFNCEFTNNLATDGTIEGDGGAIKAFFTEISGCTFTGNEANDDAGAVYAEDSVIVSNSVFTANVAGDAGGAARVQDQRVIFSGCTFDSNSAPGTGGAIMMVRGNIFNSEFTNNSTTSNNGGAIYANQNECLIDNCHFSGNSAALNGGAVYVDDGGVVSNCVITGNSASNFGGGVYLEGMTASASLVGCIITSNIADVNGGGLFVEKGKVINDIITNNFAGTNGGALTGNGDWFMANTVIWDNDATGAEKNIEVVANVATTAAANCAIDATAYNPAAWTSTNITILNASPFVGGSEADSLYSPTGSALIDAGTLDYGIEDLLPDVDLDGDARIQGAIDMGVYETEAIRVVGVSLDISSAELIVDETLTLVASVEPSFADNTSVTWSSSDESLATVDGGIVTGVTAGSATITVTTVDGGYTAICDVSVVIRVTGVTLDQTTLELDKGQTATLVATVSPADATNQTVGWVSEDENVATVDNGVVTAVTSGSTTISAVTMDGLFIATCEVTVNEPIIDVTGVILDQSALAIEKGETGTLLTTVVPIDATNASISWSSSDETIATVTDGIVTAVSDGTATIAVTTNDGGFIATCDVTVYTSVTDVSLDQTTLALEPGETATLAPTIAPEDATDATVSWISSDESIVTVADGVVTAVADGTTTITVTTNDGGFTTTCSVTVNTAVTGVSLDQTALTLEPGQTTRLVPTIAPEDATDATISWISSDETVAIVTADSVVTALADGTATITVTTTDGGFTAICDVTVNTAVTGVSLDQTTLALEPGQIATLAATVVPQDATDATISWTSSDETIATVTDGLVTAVTNGEVIITVTTSDGGFTATCDVSIKTPVTGISLDRTSLVLEPGQTATLQTTVAPEDASEVSVSWASSDDAVVTVSEGVVTAVADGTATITATTTNGGFTATCNVTVYTTVTGISLDQNALAMEPEQTATLIASVTPEDATNVAVRWNSSDETVATVTDGLVTAIANGTATIIVTTIDGGFAATCNVTVETVGMGNAEIAGFKLYPNPVTDGKLFIELSDPDITSFEIYNVLGVMIHKKQVNKQVHYELDTNDMVNSGLYFVRMIKDNAITVEQFIVK